MGRCEGRSSAFLRWHLLLLLLLLRWLPVLALVDDAHLNSEDLSATLRFRDELLEDHLLSPGIIIQLMQDLHCVTPEDSVWNWSSMGIQFLPKNVAILLSDRLSIYIRALVKDGDEFVQSDEFALVEQTVSVQVVQLEELSRQLLDTLYSEEPLFGDRVGEAARGSGLPPHPHFEGRVWPTIPVAKTETPPLPLPLTELGRGVVMIVGGIGVDELIAEAA
mmetsp:Transcript_12379/g.27172  ORF Transcript_12379/g.27172 Transcript_12379/m.27172 type:complete len:220 (+) Transcript_12379:220-879(+)|eukprot:CAMPEP_0206571568 /NCGR_PEP_ID=MMETSP0325_2-20121206/27717_1 /ASSEMBLY_ACC=CAM_ASM_000347 /TAXON_ID=2866 /ORGANISM="Crypthecodinium cohnii, Strain Seligo" /LENGTH=219 /DNA_ID=CAMNT_0054075585 /DNA_START=495 /DNA_END=1154 /DNA_ORIENTATION=-